MDITGTCPNCGRKGKATRECHWCPGFYFTVVDQPQDICSVCEAVGPPGTMKDVNETSTDLLCDKCQNDAEPDVDANPRMKEEDMNSVCWSANYGEHLRVQREENIKKFNEGLPPVDDWLEEELEDGQKQRWAYWKTDDGAIFKAPERRNGFLPEELHRMASAEEVDMIRYMNSVREDREKD